MARSGCYVRGLSRGHCLDGSGFIFYVFTDALHSAVIMNLMYINGD